MYTIQMESHERASYERKKSIMLLQKAAVQYQAGAQAKPISILTKQSKDSSLLHLPQELSSRPKVDQPQGISANFYPGLLLICFLDQSTSIDAVLVHFPNP